MKRILYVALADARGHLMRAHLVRELLAPDVDVTIATTSDDGRAFLAALGDDAHVLPGKLAVSFGDRHDYDARRTRKTAMRYLARHIVDDVSALRSIARGSDLVVNDSFHPALLAAHLVHRRLSRRVVHVHGEHLRAMVAHEAWPFRVDRWLRHGAATIEHALCGPFSARRLPPLVARCTRSRADVLADHGLPQNARVLACYLNPHYRDASIAVDVEHAAARAGLALVGVSEPFADRRGWRAADAAFIDVVAHADAFVSGAGMGALEQARVTGTPLVCLLGVQAEQANNAAARSLACVDVAAADRAALLADAVRTAARVRGDDDDVAFEIDRVRAMWRDAFMALLDRAAEENDDDDEQDRTRDRDEQPARRNRRRSRGAFAYEAAHASGPAARRAG